MSARSTLRWLGRSMLSLLTALLLVGAGVYLHYLWAGPELQPWHRARLDAEFTAADYARGRVITLAQYRERERRLLIQIGDEISTPAARADRGGLFNRYVPGSRSDPRVWT